MEGGHALIVLHRWLPAAAGELAPPTELAVGSTISAADMCAAIADAAPSNATTNAPNGSGGGAGDGGVGGGNGVVDVGAEVTKRSFLAIYI